MKFLVVDDAAIIRRLIGHVLETLEYTDYVEAADGAEALEKAARCKFDFILADWSMPNLNGLGLLKALRSQPEYRDVPFIMITCNALPDQIAEAIQAEVTDYVVKPFPADVLRTKIRSAVETLRYRHDPALQRLTSKRRRLREVSG